MIYIIKMLIIFLKDQKKLSSKSKEKLKIDKGSLKIQSIACNANAFIISP